MTIAHIDEELGHRCHRLLKSDSSLISRKELLCHRHRQSFGDIVQQSTLWEDLVYQDHCSCEIWYVDLT